MSPRPSRAPDLRGLVRALGAVHQGLHTPTDLTLAPLGARIDALCDRLEGDAAPPSPLEAALAGQVRGLARRNLRDLAATLAGLRDAQALLSMARQGQGTHTYGPQGQRTRLDPAVGQLERRR